LSGLAQTLLAADDPKQNEAALELFNRALGIDAHQPQALFYTAIAYMNSGQPQLARARFGAMLELDLPDAVRAGIQQQVAAIDSEIAGARSSAGTELHLQVTLAPELAGKVPAGAALFVFVRSPQGGPPLAVKRLMATFPQQVELSAADSPMPASRIKPGQSVQVVARISVAGTPMAGTGDLYGELSTVAGDHAQHDVLINRQNP
jgi:cytochrome c-type biogenesis protein CcmH